MTPLHLPHEIHGPVPLVMLHGLFGSGANFRTVAKRLAADRPVYCLDLRNHGSAPWGDEHTYPAMAADVVTWLDRMGLEKVDLLGHSMGGKAAMVVALQVLKRIRKLVLVDIAPVSYAHTLTGYTQAMLDVDLGTAKTRSEVDRSLAKTIDEPVIRAFLLQNLKRSDTGLYWRINLQALLEYGNAISAFPDFNGATYEGPSLFLHGDRSDYIQKRHTEAIRSLFPNTQLREVADCDHWVHAEQPEAFLQAVSSFLDHP